MAVPVCLHPQVRRWDFVLTDPGRSFNILVSILNALSLWRPVRAYHLMVESFHGLFASAYRMVAIAPGGQNSARLQYPERFLKESCMVKPVNRLGDGNQTDGTIAARGFFGRTYLKFDVSERRILLRLPCFNDLGFAGINAQDLFKIGR